MSDASDDTVDRARVRTAITVALAVAVLASLGAAAYLAVNPPATSDPFTEFYVLGPQGNASNYPQDLAPGESARVVVGVSNHERRAMTYRVRIAWNDSVTQEREWRVPDGETVERTVTVTAPEAPNRYRLRFLLYRSGDGEPYRSLRLWVTVGSAGTQTPTQDVGTPKRGPPEP